MEGYILPADCEEIEVKNGIFNIKSNPNTIKWLKGELIRANIYSTLKMVKLERTIAENCLNFLKNLRIHQQTYLQFNSSGHTPE